MQPIDLIRANQGCRSIVYDDATGLPIKPGTVVRGHPAIGYGRTLDLVGVRDGEIEQMLRNDVGRAVRDAIVAVGMPVWMELEASRQAVLIDIAYQSFGQALAQFQTVFDAVRAGNWRQAYEEALSCKWPAGSAARAKRNAAILLTAEWPL
jgi:GH24 family phage-related lysozyme (muramidase)